MNTIHTPIKIEGTEESLYAGFWRRLGSILLDILIVLPFSFLVMYINNLGMKMYFITIVPALIFNFWYHIYLVHRYGATPGKLIARMKIIKINGDQVDLKAATLRHIVMFSISLIGVFSMIKSIGLADETHYMSLTWIQKSQYMMELSPILFKVSTWLTNIWIYGELIVLLTNKRKRAIHDFMADTVIIKTQYEVAITEYMSNNKS